MSDPTSQLFEVSNEVVVISLTYALITFNDYLDAERREWMGWYLCAVVGIYMSAHIIRLGKNNFHRALKYFRDRAFKWQIKRLLAAREKLKIMQLKKNN
jgi:hypothetical protein